MLVLVLVMGRRMIIVVGVIVVGFVRHGILVVIGMRMMHVIPLLSMTVPHFMTLMIRMRNVSRYYFLMFLMTSVNLVLVVMGAVRGRACSW